MEYVPLVLAGISGMLPEIDMTCYFIFLRFFVISFLNYKKHICRVLSATGLIKNCYYKENHCDILSSYERISFKKNCLRILESKG